MSRTPDPLTPNRPNRRDSFELERFVEAQADTYADALDEVRAGQKQTHWMWFVFPQLRGLGSSATATLYGLDGADEARAYLAHPVLGPRLREVCAAAVNVPDRTATEVFGVPDDAKLRSCATLFAAAAAASESGASGDSGAVFSAVLDRYFGGEPCGRTRKMLEGQP